MSQSCFRYYFFILLMTALPAQANDVNEQLLSLSQNTEVINKGEETFNVFCAGCHKKDLSGAAGVNLKDAEWLHGSEPAQILKNMQNGFSKMPGFGSVIGAEDQHALIAYILSKREGFENLTYTLYQQDGVDDLTFDESDKVKSERIKHNFPDFELPEIPHYAIVFEGDFHAPTDQEVYLHAFGVKDFIIDLEIDGETAKDASGSVWEKHWLLKPGKQHLKFTYVTGKSGIKWKGARNILLYVVNADNTIKLFPVSTRARKESKNTSYEVKAANKYVVQQKKIIKLPPYSIAVGAPEKVNYAFNSRSCAINGLWQGDLLNVGPNIGGRGKDGSIPLGDWLYHFPAQIVPDIAKEQVCEFIKYRIDGSPEFQFSVNGIVLSVQADTSAKNKIRFVYQILENPKKQGNLAFKLPVSDKVIITADVGKITDKQWVVDIKQHAKFALELAWKGDK
ncbi:c-type cytochrome [Catenovulum adriaticum]|uniref:Cytochrome c n=1 Tax=Catenovulum adriaticum TaxID=2984846 RepID=A0ABY7ATY1_9ALTE|nr:c-type cytochrome [Catenovulum sp. TS8]WAJ72106.1 cytochrome c [Catenovulum sp. TS8]